LNKKIRVFRAKTNTKKDILLSFISANGLKENMYSEEVAKGVMLDDFFKEV